MNTEEKTAFIRWCMLGAIGSFAFLRVLLSVFQTLQLVLFLFKLRLSSFLFSSELVEGFRFCHWD